MTKFYPLVILASCLVCVSAFAAETIQPDESQRQFDSVASRSWRIVMEDPGTDDWTRLWQVDGLKATITNGPDGMTFRAGPVWQENASHAVLWTKQSFEGDIRLDYEYTKLDDRIEAVTILYLLATGSGAEGFDQDIFQWSRKREVPAMRKYFNHMNLMHISYAAFGMPNSDPEDDYIRARRYMPETSNGLRGTALQPDYLRTGLFKKGIPHQITVIKSRDDLFMRVSNEDKQLLCHWKTDGFPEVTEGRIGLRHMWTRAARYKNLRVSQLVRRADQEN